MARAAGIEMERSDMYNNKSSSYKDSFCSWPYHTMPLIRGLSRRAIARGSRATNKGLNGQP